MPTSGEPPDLLVEHGATLATRDRRALGTYRALGVTVDVLDS
jgi:hypothetical protein